MPKAITLKSGDITIVSDEDYTELSQYDWYKNSGYVCRTIHVDGKLKQVRMHRAIMHCPSGLEVDHLNHDPLDNRRENLRICTHAENMQNRPPHIRFYRNYKQGIYKVFHGTTLVAHLKTSRDGWRLWGELHNKQRQHREIARLNRLLPS